MKKLFVLALLITSVIAMENQSFGQEGVANVFYEVSNTNKSDAEVLETQELNNKINEIMEADRGKPKPVLAAPIPTPVPAVPVLPPVPSVPAAPQ